MLMHGLGVFQTKDGDEVRNTGTWAVEHLQAEGRALAIGISDFGPYPDHRDFWNPMVDGGAGAISISSHRQEPDDRRVEHDLDT